MLKTPPNADVKRTMKIYHPINKFCENIISDGSFGSTKHCITRGHARFEPSGCHLSVKLCDLMPIVFVAFPEAVVLISNDNQPL